MNVPYEEPKKPELTIETDKVSVRQSLGIIKKLLFRLSRQ